MRRAVVLIVIIASAWAGWRFLFPGDEAQIRAVLERVSETVSGDVSDGDVARLARAASLRDELAPNVVVDAGPPYGRVTGRDAIIGAVARARGTARALDLAFPEVSIAVASDRQTAVAVVTAEARVTDARGRHVEVRELEIEFARADGRADGKWMIAAVTAVSPLRRVQ